MIHLKQNNKPKAGERWKTAKTLHYTETTSPIHHLCPQHQHQYQCIVVLREEISMVLILHISGGKGSQASANIITSICILRCVLKWESRVRKMESESSKTSGTEETPFLDRATHKYCLMALMNISLVLKMGPAFCRMDRSSWRDKTLDRSSWDLSEMTKCLHVCVKMFTQVDGLQNIIAVPKKKKV